MVVIDVPKGHIRGVCLVQSNGRAAGNNRWQMKSEVASSGLLLSIERAVYVVSALGATIKWTVTNVLSVRKT
jgi:hypothetical protein